MSKQLAELLDLLSNLGISLAPLKAGRKIRDLRYGNVIKEFVDPGFNHGGLTPDDPASLLSEQDIRDAVTGSNLPGSFVQEVNREAARLRRRYNIPD